MKDTFAEIGNALFDASDWCLPAGFLIAFTTCSSFTVSFDHLTLDLRFPLIEKRFIDTFFMDGTLYSYQAVDSLRRKTTHLLTGIDTDGLGVVAPHQEDLASAMLADVGADSLQNDGLSNQFVAIFQHTIHLHNRILSGCGCGLWRRGAGSAAADRAA